MAEYELLDQSLVGILVRTRIKQFEEGHPDASVRIRHSGSMGCSLYLS